MTFEKFKHIVDLMVQNSAKLDRSHENGIDLIDFTEGYSIVINYLWGQILTPEGLDWFDWFMYEKNYLQDGIGNPELTAYSTDSGEEVEIIKDLNGLYEYLIENKYFKCVSPK